MVSDRRATAEAAEIAATASFKRVHAEQPSMTADPYYMIPKALWVKRNEPDVWDETAQLLTPADFLLGWLTGTYATDPLNAEKYYHTSADGYPSDLLNEIGIDKAMLPAVLPIGTRLGNVTAAAAAACGLHTSTQVHLATYDAICAFWGSGVSREGDVADVSGTVTSVRALVRDPLPRTERRIFSQELPHTPLFVSGGSNNLGGGLIEWLKQSFYGSDDLAYQRMEDEARAVRACADGVLFLPYLLGERAPLWDSTARGVLFGLERQHGRKEISRAVLESAAFSVEDILRVIREYHPTLRTIRVSGGLARIPLVNEIKADVTGLPVEVTSEFETTAVGAWVLAGIGAGEFGSEEDSRQLVHVRETVSPDARRHDQYANWFDVYKETYASLRQAFKLREDFISMHPAPALDRLQNL